MIHIFLSYSVFHIFDMSMFCGYNMSEVVIGTQSDSMRLRLYGWMSTWKINVQNFPKSQTKCVKGHLSYVFVVYVNQFNVCCYVTFSLSAHLVH